MFGVRLADPGHLNGLWSLSAEWEALVGCPRCFGLGVKDVAIAASSMVAGVARVCAGRTRKVGVVTLRKLPSVVHRLILDLRYQQFFP